MSITLGVHIGHDGGCAICKDGEIIVACSEERLSRVKYSNGWWLSLRYCLESTSTRLEDFDLIVFSNSGQPLSSSFDGGLSAWTDRLPRISCVDHHLSHAIGAFAFSEFESAMVFVGDAGGNLDVTESAFCFDRRSFELVQQSASGRPRCKGLGTTYEAFTNFLGFGDQESGKTMALAAYGDERSCTTPLFEVSQAGQITSLLESTHHWGVQQLGSRDGFELGPPFPSTTSDAAKNVAAYVQREFESALGLAIDTILKRTRNSNVCISGGVALNCVANTILRQSLTPNSFYPFPAGSDCGLPIGNALYGQFTLNGTIPTPKDRSMRFGRTYSPSEIASAVRRDPDTVPPGRLRLGELRYTRSSDPAKDAATLAANGGIVAWWQGPSETGPRALGGRSILADPRSSDVREHINQRVKQREWFRPFGPAVLIEDAPNFLTTARDYPYMIEAPQVRPEALRAFPACVHVDGSSRIQTVGHEAASATFRELLEAMRSTTGFASILNTSFNIREPIVESPADAVATFLCSSIDALVLEDYICFNSQGLPHG